MSIRDYGLAAPHGPNVETEKHVATKSIGGMNLMEEDVFKSILLPDDMYDETGTYWADMPLGRQVGFINKVNGIERKKEFGELAAEIKRDPLSPVGAYFRNNVIPGMGMGLEGFVFQSFYSC